MAHQTREFEGVVRMPAYDSVSRMRAVGRSRRESLWHVGGWSSALILCAVAGIWAAPTAMQPALVGIQGTAVWLLSPSFPLAAVALWKRKKALAVCGMLLSVCQLCCLVSATGRTIGHAGNSNSDDGWQLRVLTSNILLDNERKQEAYHDLAGVDADLIFLQEVTPEHAQALRQSRLWLDYRYHRIDDRPGYHGYAIISRYPLLNVETHNLAGSPMLMATVSTPQGLLRIVNVHAIAPLTVEQAAVWQEQLKELGDYAGTDGPPVLMAGDFNATTDHTPLKRLLATGLKDAFVVAGRGFGSTWPDWGGLSFPVMRLDHILTSDGIDAVEISEHRITGSDHLSVAATVRIAQPRDGT